MLETLRRIVQQVNIARDLHEALQIVVRQVKEAVTTEACSIYLFDQRHQEYVLMATDGLNPAAVGKLRVGNAAGLVGLVGEREEPIHIENAVAHPNFLYHSSAGEDNYKAYLGVPLIHQRVLQGVLVIQQTGERRFDDSEEAFAVTLSAQLAGLIAGSNLSWLAGLTDEGRHHEESDDLEVASLTGIACVPGVGIGTAVVVYPKADLNAVPDRQIDDIEAEITLFEEALAATRTDIQNLRQRFAQTLLPADQALFDVYLGILDRANLGDEVIAKIQQGNWAQGALRHVILHHVSQFALMDDDYLRERSTDIQDLGRRVLAHLQENHKEEKPYPEQTILLGDEVAAADLAEVPEGQLVAVISGKGSSNSHVTILARALGIPVIVGAVGRTLSQLDGRTLIVDGYYGHIYVSPSRDLIKEFEDVAAEEGELNSFLATLRDAPTRTADGHTLGLYVNTGLAADAGLALSVGAMGVGLFRSEMSFMGRSSFPTEEEQRVIYRQLLTAFSPRPVVMRTLDVGGDKALPYFPVKEDNPYLGWRGIRITLDHPEVFLVQIRAMLRADIGINNLRIMLPMISSAPELVDALNLIRRACRELQEEGHLVVMPPVGIMIEVPSAVYEISRLLPRVDFVSIGSNDLTQYLLAVDRNNLRVAELYDCLHPAVLKALLYVVKCAHRARKSVSICGDMASDPASAILLLAMGFDALSVNASSLLRIKWVIRTMNVSTAKKLLREVLQMENPGLIRFHLERALEAEGLGGLLCPSMREANYACAL